MKFHIGQIVRGSNPTYNLIRFDNPNLIYKVLDTTTSTVTLQVIRATHPVFAPYVGAVYERVSNYNVTPYSLIIHTKVYS